MSMRMAVVGAGLIGLRHVAAIEAASGAVLACVIDPAAAARDVALARGVPWFADLGDMPVGLADGVILATPNRIHVAQRLACVARGLPLLVETPIATDVADAQRLVEAGEAVGVPVLVGHHRRHNPLIAAVKAMIAAGRIGRVIAVQA
jgi:predicted dehydrogenase